MRDSNLYLRDMLAAITSIQTFCSDMSYEMFVADDRTTSAVIRKFEILGEAAKQIPETIRSQNEQIPWRQMAGMRDRLIHFYFGVNHRLVWTTIQTELPKLKEQLLMILEHNQA
jgi:uncharacterized protein with HEPN domain